MRVISALLVTCLLTINVNADSVVDLVDDDFDSKLGSFDTALVMFYAPW